MKDKTFLRKSVNDVHGTASAFHGKFVGLSGYFTVGLDPERTGGLDMYSGCTVRIDSFKDKVFAEKGSGQGEENHELGYIADCAKIHDAVVVIGVGAEFEAAALIAVVHAGHK